MSVYPNLTRELKNRKITVKDLAVILGISKSSAYRRLNGETEWRLTEIVSICQYLENFDANTLFLR